jgi:hypothetical protein
MPRQLRFSFSSISMDLRESHEALAKPLWGVCKREVRRQNSGVRIIDHVAGERVPIQLFLSRFQLFNFSAYQLFSIRPTGATHTPTHSLSLPQLSQFA